MDRLTLWTQNWESLAFFRPELILAVTVVAILGYDLLIPSRRARENQMTTGLAILGLLIHMYAPPRNRWANTLTLPLLGVGVLLAAAHAIVFLPLLPLSAVAVLIFGIGFLGFAPYYALAVYLQAMSQAFRTSTPVA